MASEPTVTVGFDARALAIGRRSTLSMSRIKVSVDKSVVPRYFRLMVRLGPLTGLSSNQRLVTVLVSV